jgi:BarA-like signal transduction histidine kinase
MIKAQILMQITKNTSIPDTYQKQLTQSLPDHYIVMVDGISVLLGTYYWGRVLLGTSMIL